MVHFFVCVTGDITSATKEPLSQVQAAAKLLP